MIIKSQWVSDSLANLFSTKAICDVSSYHLLKGTQLFQLFFLSLFPFIPSVMFCHSVTPKFLVLNVLVLALKIFLTYE